MFPRDPTTTSCSTCHPFRSSSPRSLPTDSSPVAPASQRSILGDHTRSPISATAIAIASTAAKRSDVKPSVAPAATVQPLSSPRTARPRPAYRLVNARACCPAFRSNATARLSAAGGASSSRAPAPAAEATIRAVPQPEPDLAREAAARAAVERLEEGMTIGLGSGRAVWRAIELIGERWGGGPPVPPAFAPGRTPELAAPAGGGTGGPAGAGPPPAGAAAGIESVELDGTVRLDAAIDGADEIDPQLGLIKGGGAALLREKLVVMAAERFLVVAEARKRVGRLGETFKLPIEVVRFGWQDTRRRLLDLLPGADARISLDAMVLTDEGHYLLDCALPSEGDLRALGDAIKATVGVVEHGLFLGLASEALLGTPGGEVEVLTL